MNNKFTIFPKIYIYDGLVELKQKLYSLYSS